MPNGIFGSRLLAPERWEEIQATIDLAWDHVSYGLNAASFFIVGPLPGAPLSDMAIAGGHFRADFDPDTMNIYRANMTNTLVPAEALEELRNRAWDEVNLPTFKQTKRAGATWLAPAT